MAVLLKDRLTCYVVSACLVLICFFFFFQKSVTGEFPSKSADKKEDQENAGELPWKLPVVIVGSLLLLSK